MVIRATIADVGDVSHLGAFVDSMPQSEARLESMASTTIQGVFIGYHVHAGGVWSGDDYFADYSHFMKDCDVVISKVKIHRSKASL